MIDKVKIGAGIFALAISAVAQLPLNAATFTSSFSPQLQIVAACQIQVRRDLDFGTRIVLNNNIRARAVIRVRCPNGVGYNIGLDAGTTAGGTTTTRKMINGTETVDYKLFKNNARTNNWGNTIGVDTKSRTGNGNWQRHRIHGLVEPQTTPSGGTYTDTITVTVTY